MSQDDRTARYIDTEGPDEEAVQLALAWAQQLGEQDEEKQDVVLAVNTKQQLERVFTSVAGEGAAKALDRKEPVQLGDSELHLMTKRIDPAAWQEGPVLALYPDEKLLNKIDDKYGVTDVLVVPWSKDTVEFWIDTWGAQALQSDASGDTPEIDYSVTKEAVRSLDLLVNTSTGITHPSDRSTCIEIFKTLQSNGIDFNPETIRGWLVAEKGWSPDHADDVREIAEGVQNNKRFQYNSDCLADDILEQWRERASST